MIWFGNINRIVPGAGAGAFGASPEDERMVRALEWVAERAPQLTGSDLVDALAASGWVDRATATRLLPAFRHFDRDRHFSEHLRRLSFRGRAANEEFRSAVRGVLQEIAGPARLDPTTAIIRFSQDDREGAVLAYPEVAFTVSGETRAIIEQLKDEMPDVLLIIARNFDRHAADQLSSILYGSQIPGTLLTVNLLLGIRAATLRYQPGSDRIVDLLGSGRPIESRDVARLVEAALR